MALADGLASPPIMGFVGAGSTLGAELGPSHTRKRSVLPLDALLRAAQACPY